MFFDGEYSRRKRGPRGIDGFVLRIDCGCPDFAELIQRVTFHNGDLDRRFWSGEAEGFVKSPIYCLRLCGRDPLAINRRKPTGINYAFTNAVPHLKEISSAISRVDKAIRISRPRQRLDDNAIDAEKFLASAAGMVVVESHGL